MLYPPLIGDGIYPANTFPGILIYPQNTKILTGFYLNLLTLRVAVESESSSKISGEILEERWRCIRCYHMPLSVAVYCTAFLI